MQILYSAVSEMDTHILRPVINQISCKILEDINIKKIIGNNIFIDTGFTSAQYTDDGKHKSNTKQNQFKVQTDINLNPANLKWDALSGYYAISQGIAESNIPLDYNAIFSDPIGKISMHEMLMPTYISLQCSLLLADRAIAYELPSLLYRKFSPGIVFTESIAYDYAIPKDFFSMLYSLYKLRRFPEPLTFKEYLDLGSNKYINYLVNRTNTKKELVASKTYINAIASVDYGDSKPSEVKINKTVGQYETSFTYHIQFSRPDTLILRYPCVVDNKLVPEQMLPSTESTNQPIRSLDGPTDPIAHNELYVNNMGFMPAMIKFPYYDNWNVPKTNYLYRDSYWPFASMILLINEESSITTENFAGDIDDTYTLHPKVKEVLKLQKNDSFVSGCIIHIAVFTDDNLTDVKNLSLDEDLNLNVKCSNIYKTRRIVFSQITDLKYLDKKWLPYIKENEDFFKTIDTGDNDARRPLRITKNCIIVRR